MRSLYASKNELTALKNRIAKFEEDPSLVGEIGIARIVLEALIGACKNNNELIVSSTKIHAFVTLIAELVKHETTTPMVIQ